MLVDISSSPPNYLTDKYNANNNEFGGLWMIALDTISVYLTTSEISSNQSKHFQGLYRWGLVPLGPTLIYNTKDRGSLL